MIALLGISFPKNEEVGVGLKKSIFEEKKIGETGHVSMEGVEAKPIQHPLLFIVLEIAHHSCQVVNTVFFSSRDFDDLDSRPVYLPGLASDDLPTVGTNLVISAKSR